jgi:serine/threonine-protein kinase
MDERIVAFQNCGISFENSSPILCFLENNRHLLRNRSQCLRHGDFSIGNIILSGKNEVTVIDWEVDDFDNYGDPWLDFTDVVWGADKSPHFASGLIKGYFENEPPYGFWELLMFYVAGRISTWSGNRRDHECLHNGCDSFRIVRRRAR